MAEFEILYGEGISRHGEIIEHGVAQGIIDKSGSWYSYKDDRIGQGKENVREFLKSHPEIAADIEQQIRAVLLPEKKKFSEADAEVPDAVEAVAKEA
jgi:recombination protein RecA